MTITVNPLNTIWYRCSKCEHSFLLSTEDPYIHLLKSKNMNCPDWQTCKGKLKERSLDSKNLPSGYIPRARRISGLDLYQASLGIGLPGERKCSPSALKKLLLGAVIKDIHLEKAGDPNKALLVSISLDNGKTIHVGVSTKGPIVYKMTESAYGR
jgi:hypothetical protein